MNKVVHILTAKNTFRASLLLVALALALLAPKAAVNVDELLHYPHAKKVVNWYFTGGKDISSLHTPKTNLKYYGQSVDNFTALFNRIFNIENEFLVRHYTGAFFFWLLLLFSGLLAKRMTGYWLVATLCIPALILMPRLAGQAFGNLKDIPFAVGYVAGIMLIIQFLEELPRPRWNTTILLGLAIAFTVSVRAGGYILFAYLGLGMLVFFISKPFYLIQVVSTKPVFVRLLGQGAAIFIIGYFAGLLFWPFALQNIFVHPWESLQMMEHYQVSIKQVFEGQMQWSTQLPWYYLPKWLLISTPLFILTGLLIFLFLFFRDHIIKNRLSRQFFFEGFVLFAIAFPFLYVIVIQANLYSGVRQMLFIFPLIGVLAVWGIYKMFSLIKSYNTFAARIFSVSFFILLFFPAKHQASTFPVDYVYFNALAGGNKNAWGNYEYDYYFHALREPAEFLITMVDNKEINVAINCNLANYFSHHPNINFQYTPFMERSSFDWDFGIFGLNYIHPYLLKNDMWKPAHIIKIFYHKENPVAVLAGRGDKTDFYGISEIKNGNLPKGIALLENAVKDDSLNSWLYVNLAKASLLEGDFSDFEFYLEKGKKIHPFFEPFYLLEATRLFNEGKYSESLSKLNILFEINPFYHPAEKLLEEVKRKVN